jgi:hypothetical protein
VFRHPDDPGPTSGRIILVSAAYVDEEVVGQLVPAEILGRTDRTRSLRLKCRGRPNDVELVGRTP